MNDTQQASIRNISRLLLCFNVDYRKKLSTKVERENIMTDDTKHVLVKLCKEKNPIFVLDVYNHIFRYFFAHKDLSVTLEDGTRVPTGHLFGFTRNILWLKEKFPDCAIVLANDGYDQTRRDVDPNYKAERVHEIEPGEYVLDIFKMCSLADDVYVVYDKKYEADDAAASVVRTIKHLCNKFSIDKQIYLLSSDKDWWQLIDDGRDAHCKISTVKKWGAGEKWFEEAQIIDEAKVGEEFNGTKPENLLKFRAITGDSSDNLKGYYRFYKKNAAIIAENFDYDIENNQLVLREGCEMRASWDKFLNTVTSDMSVFKKNYEIMSLKDFDFDIIPISDRVSDEDISHIVDTLETFKLYYYMQHVTEFSKYADKIKAAVAEKGAGQDVGDQTTVECDLNDLL